MALALAKGYHTAQGAQKLGRITAKPRRSAHPFQSGIWTKYSASPHLENVDLIESTIAQPGA